MTLANLANGDGVEVQYNPTELEEEVGPIWNRLKVLGLSHEVLQYANTSNHAFNFELTASAFDDERNRINDLRELRLFLLSLCVAPRGAQDIIGGSPPRILFVWPKLVSLTCVIGKTLKIKHVTFNFDGEPIRSVFTIPLEEIRDVRLTSEDVRSNGTFR